MDEAFPLRENYARVSLLGQGEYGRVFLYKKKDECVDNSLPMYVAIKSINNSGNARMSQLREREMLILSKVKSACNDNIIKYLGFFENEGEFESTTLLVMEACNGDLENVIRSNRELNLVEIRKLTKQILNGLGCLHNMDTLRNEKELIIHR